MITAQLKQALDFVARQGRKLFGSPRQDAPAGSIETLALDLLSERGEATSMARADAIVRLYASLSKSSGSSSISSSRSISCPRRHG